jgi:hypothetical protein
MRRLLILVILSFMVSFAYSQNKEKDINKAGFKLDINSSYLVGSIADTTEFGGRTGFSAGIFYREALGGIFGGQIEVRYVQMGGVNKVYDVETQLDYIRFGAQFKLYPLTSTLGANAFLGFEYGILLNAKQQDIADKETFIELKDYYSSGDYGIHVGAGLDFDFGLTTDLRLYLGLADITEGTPDARNLSIQYHLGWGF